MAATDFTGYTGIWSFAAWANTTLTIQTRPASGHAYVNVATGLTCKSNAASGGLAGALMGAQRLSRRRFYIPRTYRDGGETLTVTRAWLDEGNNLIDQDGVHWVIEGTEDPGDASEHYEVEGARAPHAS